MAISLPSSPTVGQTYTLGGKIWTWNGTAWKLPSTTSTLPVLYGGTGVTTSTGTGSTVLSDSPTFTGTVSAAAITASGTMGIGTSSPIASKLHIYNRTDANAAPNTPVVRIEHQDVNAIGTGGSNGGILSFYNIQQNNTGWTSDVIIGKIDFSSSQPTSGVAELNAAIWSAREASDGTQKNAYIAFSTAAGASPPAERMRINSAGTVSIPGTLSTAAYTETIVALGTVAAAATLAITAGTFITATLTTATACTFTMPTVAAGKSFILYLRQPAAGTATTATFTNVKWGSAGAPTITATVGKMDILSFSSDGTAWYGAAAQGYTY